MGVNKLVYPPEWDEVWSKYPHGLTIFEAVMSWVNKTNLMVDLLNSTVEEMETFTAAINAEVLRLYTEVLPENVEAVLTTWYDNGQLADLINLEILGGIETQLNNIFMVYNNNVLIDNPAIPINLMQKQGRPIKLTGTIVIKTPIVIDTPGSYLIGDTIAFGDEVLSATTIKASDDFVGEALVIFKHSSLNYIRSVGMKNITVDGGTLSDCAGVVGYNLYDGCVFENVVVQEIMPNKNVWAIKPISEFSGVSQTIVFINCLGLHRGINNTAPVFYGSSMQECVFIMCKMWGGGVNNQPTWKFVNSSGITMINPSAVCFDGATQGIGFEFEFKRSGSGVSIINPTIENVKTIVNFKSDTVRGWGVITSVPNVGETITQGAVSGVVNSASAIGVYLQDITGGSFVNGDIFKDGVVIGNLTSFDYPSYQNVVIENPRILGAVGGNKIVNINNCQECEITIPSDNSNGSMSYDITIGTKAINTKLTLKKPITYTDNGLNTNVIIEGYLKEVRRSLNPGSSNIFLPKAFKGMQINVIKDGAYIESSTDIRPYAGDTINGLANYLQLMADGSNVVLFCIADGAWIVKSFNGTIGQNSVYQTNLNTLMSSISSKALGTEHSGYTWTNSGASGYVNFDLPIALVGATYKFYRKENFEIRVTPRVGEQIRGTTAVSNHITLDTNGAYVEIKCIQPGMWEILAKQGTVTLT